MLPGLLPLLSLALVSAQAPAPPASADARPYAARLRHLVGQRSGPVVLRSVHAEGQVLVLTLDGGIGWRAFVPVARMSEIQLERQCRRPEVRGFFNGRRRLRIDTMEMGQRRWPGQLIARCP